MFTQPPLSIGQCASLACLWEVTATKPGNVHRGADFADMTFADFMLSAVAIAPYMEHAVTRRVGETVRLAVAATRQLTPVNTNLGIVLLFAPIAAVPREVPLSAGLPSVLSNLNAADAADVYDVIRGVNPGGLEPCERRVGQANILDLAPPDLLAAMRLAADHDLIARQYANGFAQVSGEVVPWLVEASDQFSLVDRIVLTHLRLMSRYPDSLIARKGGTQLASESAARAASVIAAGAPKSAEFYDALADFDFWLRSDGNRRNPGTTADLIAAGLFMALRDGILKPPFQ